MTTLGTIQAPTGADVAKALADSRDATARALSGRIRAYAARWVPCTADITMMGPRSLMAHVATCAACQALTA